MTNPLARLERALTRLVEGAVELVGRPQLQPVQIARRLATAMEEGAMVGPRGSIAPNYYVVTLAPSDYARFEGAAAGMRRELERHLVEACARLRLRSLDPFLVELRSDPDLSAGRFDVRAAFLGRSESQDLRPEAAPGTSPAAGIEHTMVMPVSVAPAPPAAVLEVVGPDGSPARVLPLADPVLTIGRAPENGLVLAESAVSRHHAELRRQGNSYAIADLGSTNGIMVNGKPVQQSPLNDGDRLQIGTTALVFRSSRGTGR